MTHIKRILLVLLLTVPAVCQGQMTIRQQSYPVTLPSEDENIDWQQDIYREISLYDRENQGLYCPVEPTEHQKGLFTLLFQLAVKRYVPIYRYNLDGEEKLNEQGKADIKEIMRNHHIFYTEEDSMLIVNDEDIPASDILMYYIKEGVYYDQSNSAFRTKVQAICPVLLQSDEFGEGVTRYPLFWMRYQDIETYLTERTIIPDYQNKADRISLADYFTLNRYRGQIYKVANAFGTTLRQSNDNDSVLHDSRQLIEQNIKRVKKQTYNIYTR